jgi:type VI protein secretion system component VasF
MPGDPATSEATNPDPEALLRLLDLELKQKRAQWQQAAARHRTTRVITFFSLLLVVAAAIVAFYFLFTRANTERSRSSDSISQAPAGRP